MALECYFSHSWAREDVSLNVLVWQTIAPECVLYVDRQGSEDGAYYINRLEELIRKSDIFVSVLTHRQCARPTDNRPDYTLACSPGSLFEVRLAERARKPRWIIYDDRTGFVPPNAGSDLVVYTPISTTEEIERGGRTIQEAGRQWLQRLNKALNVTASPRSRRAALLVDHDLAAATDLQNQVEASLRRAGYEHVHRIEPVHTDAEAIAILHTSGLLVAEMGAASVDAIYGMAHALFIPSIRFVRTPLDGRELPRLLDGHPGGYQHDLIVAADTATLVGEVGKRAGAMRDNRGSIDTSATGCAYLRRRLYRPHQVFFSHNLAASDAELLRFVFERLNALGVRAWEYRHNNRAGVVWKEELQAALSDATDVVFIIGKEFEVSEACAGEIRAIGDQRQSLKSVTPFLWRDRDRPTPEFSAVHHERLPPDPELAANIVVDRVVSKLFATSEVA